MKSKNILLLFFVGITSFSKAQAPGEWTWMKGSNLPNSFGNFGTQGVSAPTNNPPALYEAYEWTDLNGNFWLFGGLDYNSDLYNTLWKFDVLTNEWTWVNGSNITNAMGVYGINGISAPNNTPGARSWGGITWVDKSGDLWLFGGLGFDAVGNQTIFNDLWKYNISTNQWVWMKGANISTTSTVVISGIKGVANIANTPDGRVETNAGIADGSGNLWLLGGINYVSSYNDLWKYNIASNSWTWVSGNQNQNNSPNYGTLNVSSSINDPGDRACYMKFIDPQNNLYFIGSILPPAMTKLVMDVWKYNTTNNEWTCIGGSIIINDSIGLYQNKCDSILKNFPDARFETRATWSDECGFFFFGGFDTNENPHDDLWYYNIDNNKFTWLSGNNIGGSMGNYGSLGLSNPSNLPPSRAGALPFKDKQSNLWVFGGMGNSFPSTRLFNDLWRYKIDTSCVKLCSKSLVNQNPPIDTLNTNYIPLTIIIPNVFTPNGDAANNNFTVKVENYKSYHIVIYDCWGLKLFETSDANMHWNGKPNNIGADCPDGTYYYIINLIDKGGKTSNYKGFLSLFR